MTIYGHVWYRTAVCDLLRWEVMALGRHSYSAKYGVCVSVTSCLPVSQPYPACKSWFWFFSNSFVLWNMLQPLLVFIRPFHFPPYFPTPYTPQAGFFFYINKQSHMCVGHSFDRHTGTDAAFAGFILTVKWCCNSLSTKQWHHHVSLFLFAQSNVGETE